MCVVVVCNGNKVVNMRKRYNEVWDVEIDRRSIFGNPYKGEVYGREECIRLHREYFKKRMREDPGFRKAVNGLQGKVLGCWCKPKGCHGDVIVEYLDSVKRYEDTLAKEVK